MSPERWQQVCAIFEAALQRTSPERAAYLDQVCVGDPALRAEVARLLDNHEQANAVGFLAGPGTLGGSEPATGPDESQTAEKITDPVESTVRYQPLRFHAAGGLGEVFLARDEHLPREVALKRIRPDRADEPEYRRRFLREAEITSKLAHPGIVPVFGLAQSADGRPGYAMRFIEGETLHDALQRFHAAEKPGRDTGERSLALRQLLTRFVAACNTVAYAHSRGVIHRDLKPGNILLGAYGETLVVDWGLAKELGSSDAEQDSDTVAQLRNEHDTPSETKTGVAMGTLAYMSPEQEAGRWKEVGPASDIFSLGATLHAILTGKAPSESVRKGVLALPTERQRAPTALAAICAKTLASHSADRYATATDLATDVERWLADEPVRAYREPLAARLGRWYRRNTRVAGLLAILVMVVAASFVTTTWLYLLRNEQLQRAEGNLALARRAVDESYRLISDNPELQRSEFAPLRTRLLATALRYSREFVSQAADRPELQEELCNAYLRIHEIKQAERFSGILDERQQEEARRESYEAARKALAIRERLLAVNLEHREYRRRVAQGYDHVGAARPTKDDTSWHEQARDRWEELNREDPKDGSARQDLANSWFNIALGHHEGGRPADGLRASQKSLAVVAQLAQESPADASLQRLLALNLELQADLLGQLQQPEKRRELVLQAVGIREKAPEGFASNDALDSGYERLALAYSAEGCYEKARQVRRKALNHVRGKIDRVIREHPTVMSLRGNLALFHYMNGLDQVRELNQNQQLFRFLPFAPQVGSLLAGGAGTPLHRASFVCLQPDEPPAYSEARGSFQEAILLCEELTASGYHRGIGDGNVPYVHGVCHFNIGVLDSWLERRHDMFRRCRQGLDQLRQAAKKDPNDLRYREELQQGFVSLAGDYAQETQRVRIRNPEKPEEAQRQEDEALTLLREAVSHGFRDKDRLRSDPALAVLRGQPDFAKLLAELDAQAKAPKP